MLSISDRGSQSLDQNNPTFVPFADSQSACPDGLEWKIDLSSVSDGRLLACRFATSSPRTSPSNWRTRCMSAESGKLPNFRCAASAFYSRAHQSLITTPSLHHSITPALLFHSAFDVRRSMFGVCFLLQYSTTSHFSPEKCGSIFPPLPTNRS